MPFSIKVSEPLHSVCAINVALVVPSPDFCCASDATSFNRSIPICTYGSLSFTMRAIDTPSLMMTGIPPIGFCITTVRAFGPSVPLIEFANLFTPTKSFERASAPVSIVSINIPQNKSSCIESPT